jgi:LuxR family transcriptional regulator, quorum-sensing system regulator BjaR1
MDLKDNYAKRAFDRIDELDSCTTIGQVMSSFANALADFGYTSFLITGVLPEPPQRLEPCILLNGWPKGWIEHYRKSNYYCDDPVAGWCRRSVDPFEWSEVPIDAARSPRAVEVMKAANNFGLKKGFVVPILHCSGSRACVTMAGERPDNNPRSKRTLQLISMYAHSRCAALLGCGSDEQRRQALTQREREVLAWTAEGKSSWEIGEILDLSERTVNWHAEQAKRKLDAVNRMQAVIKAVRAGEIW